MKDREEAGTTTTVEAVLAVGEEMVAMVDGKGGWNWRQRGWWGQER